MALSSSNELRFTKWPMLWRHKWTVWLRSSWFNQHLGGFVNGNDFKWLDFICPFTNACTFNQTLCALQLQVHATICAHIQYAVFYQNVSKLKKWQIAVNHTLITWSQANYLRVSYAIPQCVGILYTAFHLWSDGTLIPPKSSSGCLC